MSIYRNHTIKILHNLPRERGREVLVVQETDYSITMHINSSLDEHQAMLFLDSIWNRLMKNEEKGMRMHEFMKVGNIRSNKKLRNRVYMSDVPETTEKGKHFIIYCPFGHEGKRK